jgi:hypothetical protein
MVKLDNFPNALDLAVFSPVFAVFQPWPKSLAHNGATRWYNKFWMLIPYTVRENRWILTELDGTKKLFKVKLDNFPVFSTKKQEKSIFAGKLLKIPISPFLDIFFRKSDYSLFFVRLNVEWSHINHKIEIFEKSYVGLPSIISPLCIRPTACSSKAVIGSRNIVC